MELFYAHKVDGGFAYLDAEDSAHCVRVLRHRAGDAISVIDGTGSLLHCTLTDDSPKEAVARVVSEETGWGTHHYYLRMAVCPTKNIDRYEWFVEKAVELGVDEIVPVIGEHSERRTLRLDRLQRIAVSAAKQSLKAAVPVIAGPVSMRDFIAACHSERSEGIPNIRLIAYCSDDVAPRGSIIDAIAEACDGVLADGECRYRAPFSGARTCPFPAAEGKVSASAPCVTVLIGPEGDFSQEEVRTALDAGFIPVHLGPSRLRTATAAITAIEAVYLTLGLQSAAYDSAPSPETHASGVPSNELTINDLAKQG